jgi:hypothetical protein
VKILLNRVATKKTKMTEQKQVQSKTTMILISFFLGGLGIHRLMMGYSNWWLMLITLGGCGIWAIIDFIRVITGSMQMADGSVCCCTHFRRGDGSGLRGCHELAEGDATIVGREVAVQERGESSGGQLG